MDANYYYLTMAQYDQLSMDDWGTLILYEYGEDNPEPPDAPTSSGSIFVMNPLLPITQGSVVICNMLGGVQTIVSEDIENSVDGFADRLNTRFDNPFYYPDV